MRLFFAIDPDPPARERLARAIAQVRRGLSAEADHWRWVAADLVHVTMQFLGELDAAAEGRVREAVGLSIPRPPFELTVSTVGVFPPHRSPQVLWLGVSAGAEALADIHRDLADRLTDAGIAVEQRPFAPHLTIARVRRGRARGAAPAGGPRDRPGSRAEAPAEASVDPIAWRVDRVTLYASDRSGPSPRYTARHAVRLADAP